MDLSADGMQSLSVRHKLQQDRVLLYRLARVTDHMIAKSMLLSFTFHIYLDKKINLVLHRTFLRLVNVFQCGILGSLTALLHSMSLEFITGLLQCRSSSIWQTSFKMHWNSDIKVSENMIHDQGCWKCNSIYAEHPKWFYEERYADRTSTLQPHKHDNLSLEDSFLDRVGYINRPQCQETWDFPFIKRK